MKKFCRIRPNSKKILPNSAEFKKDSAEFSRIRQNLVKSFVTSSAEFGQLQIKFRQNSAEFCRNRLKLFRPIVIPTPYLIDALCKKLFQRNKLSGTAMS